MMEKRASARNLRTSLERNLLVTVEEVQKSPPLDLHQNQIENQEQKNAHVGIQLHPLRTRPILDLQRRPDLERGINREARKDVGPLLREAPRDPRHEVDHILPGVRAQCREADHADGRATI